MSWENEIFLILVFLFDVVVTQNISISGGRFHTVIMTIFGINKNLYINKFRNLPLKIKEDVYL